MSPLHSVRIRDHPGGSLSDAERARCAREAADLIYSAGATVLGGTMVKCGWRRGRWVLCAAVLAAWACDDGSKGGAGADEDAGSADALPETDLDAAVDAGPPPMCGDEPACVDAVCVDVGDGPVCRAPCGADDACPEGETCREVADGLGATVRVCLPEDADPCGDVDTTRDVDHCGVCGWVCRFVGAAARCVDGICELGPCDEGAVDVDGDPATGCECTPLPSGDEACDEADNDCDGVVDEGFDLGRDIEHCGACGRSCAFGNLQAACDKGECAYGDCLQGWVDLDGDAENGCECPLAEAGEVCNGADDDCDEQTDEGVLNACGQCGDVPEEVCNGLDDDCDGETDEGLLNVCGACGPVPMEACDAADNDCDGETDEGVLNACGACGPVPMEACDGADNDCDGETDEGVLNACGACGPVPMEACDGADNDCDGETDEGALNACGACGPVPMEACDGADNDCDGETDEGFDLQNDAQNCGMCGRVCVTPDATPVCDAGVCRVGTCDDGFDDVDGDPENGCEVDCAENPGVGDCPGIRLGLYVIEGRPFYLCQGIPDNRDIVRLALGGLWFSIEGNQLRAVGAGLDLTGPVPVGADFILRGTWDDDRGGCLVDWVLEATFVTPTRWEGELRMSFRNCPLSDCRNTTFQIAGRPQQPPDD